MTEDKDDINPMVRIADALEGISKILEKFSNPPTICRGNIDGKESMFLIPGDIKFISG